MYKSNSIKCQWAISKATIIFFLAAQISFMEGKITMTTILSLSLIFPYQRENGCLFYQEVSLEHFISL
jgi:hypothetical protein